MVQQRSKLDAHASFNHLVTANIPFSRYTDSKVDLQVTINRYNNLIYEVRSLLTAVVNVRIQQFHLKSYQGRGRTLVGSMLELS